MAAPTIEKPLKRGPGRPRGLGKVVGSGRKKGTPNRSTVQTRDRIRELADPIAFLADVMAGKRMVGAGEPGDIKKTWCYPTLAQRVQASETLLRKLLPDLRATEHTGDVRPTLTQIVRTIVSPGGEAAEAKRDQANRPAGNGADEGTGQLRQDTESGEAHTHFRGRTRG